MSNVGFATLSVIPSFQGFQSRLSAGVAAPLTAAGRDGGRRYGDAAGKEAGSRFRNGFGAKLKGFAPLAGLAIGAGAVAFFKDAVDSASDLSESGNKINAIFGDAQDEVQGFAAGSAESLGQTQLQALDAASTFGTFGKAAGLAGGDLAGFSTELVSLSTDMASFFNTDVNTAIEAIGSGLRGEAEPLRQFGVLLDDATLRAEALKQGLVSSTKDALTPQQKVLAAHAVILKQTTDAQGDFARTSDGLANQQRILTAQWEEMKATVGAELLPVVTDFVSFLSKDALPALSNAGGLARDAADAFRTLPPPVQAAAVAFGVLKLASASGLNAGVVGAANKTSGAMDTLRLRTMLAADEYRSLRTASITAAGAGHRFDAGAGRITAGLGAMKVAASGAGSAMRRGIGGLTGMLGGPWGIAIVGATALIAKFWGAHQEAQAHIEEHTAALNQQTGALTESNRQIAITALEESGLLQRGKDAAVSLGDVTNAALGNADAMRGLREEEALRTAQIDAQVATEGQADVALVARRNNLQRLISGLEDESSAVGKAREAVNLKSEADKESKAVTSGLTTRTEQFTGAVDRARGALEKLIEAEEKRALAAIQQRRDAIALRETFRAATEEARKGNHVLFDGSKAADENMSSLLDLAEQWTNSKGAVVNAKGAYEDMRRKFIDVARQMGATKEQARNLADQLLKVPKRAPIEFQSKGYQERLAEIKELRKRARELGNIEVDYTPRGFGASGFATGGMIGGLGTGTSDSNLIRASRGEFMQPTASVDYYGTAFMEAVRRRMFPKPDGYAKGGPIATKASSSSGGVAIQIGQVVAHDYNDFMRQTQRRAQRAALGGHG